MNADEIDYKDPLYVLQGYLMKHTRIQKLRCAIYNLSLGKSFLLNRLDRIDGHGHSNISDGTLSIEDLLRVSSSFEDTTIFLTDHNTLEHFRLLANHLLLTVGTEPTGIVPGTELTCQIDGVRCHVILLAPPNNAKLSDFLKTQRDKYFVRELGRLSKICAHSALPYDEENYESFCGTRTPNWTVTLNYLSTITNSTDIARALMRQSSAPEEQKGWWLQMPKLSEIYSLFSGSSLLFLCHIGDLIAKLGSKRIAEELDAMPTLFIDLSEGEGHLPNLKEISQLPIALRRTEEAPTLVGSDYHRTRPRPVEAGGRLRGALAHSLLKTAETRYPSSSSLLVNGCAYISLIGAERILHNRDVFHSLSYLSINEWIEQFIVRADRPKRMVAESILGLAIVKDEIACKLLNALLNDARDHNELLEQLGVLVRNATTFYSTRSTSQLGVAGTLAIADVCMRLGLYTWSTSLLCAITKMIPAGLISGYGGAIQATQAMDILKDFWALMKSGDGAYKEASMIWRVKTAASALSSVVRTYITGGTTRHGMLSKEALKASEILLVNQSMDTNSCIEAYRNLIYDHIGITVILPDGRDEYEYLLSMLQIPVGWKIHSYDLTPRRDYHHRLWVLLQSQTDLGTPTMIELMVKHELDFKVGRAYQWAEKNCSLARGCSPWLSNDSFDRGKAISHCKQYKSITSLLFEEVRQWQRTLEL